jgi:hypothetical protein
LRSVSAFAPIFAGRSKSPNHQRKSAAKVRLWAKALANCQLLFANCWFSDHQTISVNQRLRFDSGAKALANCQLLFANCWFSDHRPSAQISG